MSTVQQPSETDEIIDAFTASGHPGPTVGYGNEYPAADIPGLVFHDNNNACGIEHDVAKGTYGFDMTTFGTGKAGAVRFIAILEAVGLDPLDDFVRVYRDMGYGINTDYADRFLHCWVNENILIACTANPIAGTNGFPSNMASRGYAGMVGVGGTQSLAETAFEQIRQTATKSKGHRKDGLFV